MHKSNTIIPEEHAFLQMSISIDPIVKELHYSGTLPESRKPSVAIVGARRPSGYGTEVAYSLSYELAAAGVVIISGLALGIDGIAHQAALDAHGTTLAILGGGLDAIYPSRHRHLAARIVAANGALLSEYPDGAPALNYHFLERNRIISGLADVVVVVEAAQRSGTLSTASWGLQQGKTVMAVPGNITSPLSEGCNQLLRSGASVVTETSDVLQALGLNDTAKQTSLLNSDNPAESAIIALLLEGLRDGDILQQKSSLSTAIFQQAMTMLELTGTIRALGANQWSLARTNKGSQMMRGG